jgi:hypothetical protein
MTISVIGIETATSFVQKNCAPNKDFCKNTIDYINLTAIKEASLNLSCYTCATDSCNRGQYEEPVQPTTRPNTNPNPDPTTLVSTTTITRLPWFNNITRSHNITLNITRTTRLSTSEAVTSLENSTWTSFSSPALINEDLITKSSVSTVFYNIYTRFLYPSLFFLV